MYVLMIMLPKKRKKLCQFSYFIFFLLLLLLVSKTMTFVEAVKQSPVSVVEMIICFFSVWSILGLAGFHTYLIMSNLTTNEDIKGSFSKRNHVSVTNPYSLGSIFRNCYSILCSPIGPRFVCDIFILSF